MDPQRLKSEYGGKFTFWGGAIDTQKTLPFGTPEEVAAEVKSRIDTFGPGGGFVFSTVHNIQARVPGANLLAMIDTFNNYRKY